MSDTTTTITELTNPYGKYLEEFFAYHALIAEDDIPSGVTGTPWEVSNESGLDHFWKRFIQKEIPFEKIQEFVEKGKEVDAKRDTLYKNLKVFPYGFLTPVLLLGQDLETTFQAMIDMVSSDTPTPPHKDVDAFIYEMEKIRDIMLQGITGEYTSGKQAPEVTSRSEGFSIPSLESPIEKAIDTLLAQSGSPGIEELFSLASKTAEVEEDYERKIEALVADHTSGVKKVKSEHRKTRSELKEAKEALTKLALTPTLPEVRVDATLDMPEGNLVYKKASEIFPDIKFESDFLSVPFWEWDGPHPDVPMIDESYIFRPDLLSKVLYALITNQRMYLQGDTGSGKTTLIEQVAAHLNYPFLRVNFDSEITRMDLIGRDVLKDGASHFVDGMLPKAMSGPYITCFDEIDFVRPDIAYVMQAALEGNGLRITEDGDRLVTPDPSFRMFGTGNTVGQGDEHGMYQGARPQSLAFLDRFTVWANVPYLDPDQREDLVKSKVPSLTKENRERLIQYTNEHLELFQSAKVLQPISPRGMLAVARAASVFSLKDALKMTILDRASSDDKSALAGIIDRVLK